MTFYEISIIILGIIAIVGVSWPFISYMKGYMETSGRIDALRKKSPKTKEENNAKEEN